MELPKQLQNPEFRFVLIRPKTKIPFEFNWQIKSNYPYNSTTITNHIGNLGIVCGYGELVILDIDNPEFVEIFDKKLTTFSVKTGSGGRHYYFICDGKFNKNYYVLGKGVGELRVNKSQVIVPGCLHPSGNKYEVYEDVPIQEVKKSFLKHLLNDYLSKEEKHVDISRSGQDWKECCEMIEAGYSFDEVNKELMLIGSGRWKSETMNYRVNTYCNALKAIKNVR